MDRASPGADSRHQQVIEASGLAEFKNADDVGMVQLRDHAAFTIEELVELGVPGGRFRQEFERDVMVEVRLAGLEDEANADAAYKYQNFELWRSRRNPLDGWDVACGGRGKSGV